MEEQKMLQVTKNDNFLSKVFKVFSKIFVNPKFSAYFITIDRKRAKAIKSFNKYIAIERLNDEQTKQLFSYAEKEYENYLGTIDKYIKLKIYAKVLNDTATRYEQEIISGYYQMMHIKETELIEHKHKRQEFLLKKDFEILQLYKPKAINIFKPLYIYKMDKIYKGLLKHYSIQLTDSGDKREEVYGKIFSCIEEYISEILPLKMEDNNEEYKNILEDYNKLLKFRSFDLEEPVKYIEKNMILLNISRYLFTHSLPFLAAEKCYVKLIKQTRKAILSSNSFNEKEEVYQFLISLIEDYNVKLLCNKVNWDDPVLRQMYKEFWDKYQKCTNRPQKEVLFIKYDIIMLNRSGKEFNEIKAFYKEKLRELGAMRKLQDKAEKIEVKYVSKNGMGITKLKSTIIA